MEIPKISNACPAFFQPKSATRTAVISQVCSSKKPRDDKTSQLRFPDLRQLYPSMLTIARTHAVAAAPLGTKQSQQAGRGSNPLQSSAILCFHLISIRFLEKNHS